MELFLKVNADTGNIVDTVGRLRLIFNNTNCAG